jgi:hypothetical protein
MLPLLLLLCEIFLQTGPRSGVLQEVQLPCGWTTYQQRFPRQQQQQRARQQQQLQQAHRQQLQHAMQQLQLPRQQHSVY